MTGIRKLLDKMAKRRKRQKTKSTVQRRKQFIPQPKRVLHRPKREELRYAQDRRLFRPAWIEGYKKIDGSPVTYQATTTNKITGRAVNLGISRIGFTDPRRVVVCKRRNSRRRTLFAKKIIGRGRGTGGFKKRIMREISKVRC